MNLEPQGAHDAAGADAKEHDEQHEREAPRGGEDEKLKEAKPNDLECNQDGAREHRRDQQADQIAGPGYVGGGRRCQ